MVYGETGRRDLLSFIKPRMVAFWSKLSSSNLEKISDVIYSLLRELDDKGIYEAPWVRSMKIMLNDAGLSFAWDLQDFINKKCILSQFKQVVQDQFQQNWRHDIESKPKCEFYKLFKSSLQFEPYLININRSKRIALTKFRTRNRHLPIETGSWYNTDRNLRKCQTCKNALGDEYHYLFECVRYSNQRKRFFDKYDIKSPSMFRCIKIMATPNDPNISHLATFVKYILESENILRSS